MYKIYVGLTTKDGVRIHRSDALRIIKTELTRHQISGATISDSIGLWNGKSEQSIIIECTEPLNYIGRILKKIFNQSSVLYSEIETKDMLL